MSESTSVTGPIAEFSQSSRSPAAKPSQSSRSRRRPGRKTSQHAKSPKPRSGTDLAESSSGPPEIPEASEPASIRTPTLESPGASDFAGRSQPAHPEIDPAGGHRNAGPDRRPGEPRPENRQGPSWRPAPSRDHEDLARKAWQIYSAEIAEDGVTLFDDKDASALARRAFRLAQVFLDAQHQHTTRGPRRDHPTPANGGGASAQPRRDREEGENVTPE